MKPRRNSLVTLSVVGLDPDGKGVGQSDGNTFRVPGAMPGDRVEVRVGRMRKQMLESRMTALVEPGLERISPVCTHFGTCGGCLWQNIPYEDQVRLKLKIVRETLAGSEMDLEFEDPMVAEEPFFYRNKMEFSFGQKGGEVILGLHQRGKFDKVFDLSRCHLQSEVSNRIVAAIRDFARSEGLQSYDLKRHRGLLRFLTIREGVKTGEVMVNLVTSDEPFESRPAMVKSLLESVPEVSTIIHTVNRRMAQVAVGDFMTVLHGEGFIREELGGLAFRISPNSFFQTNPRQAERMYDLVHDYADPRPGDRALDLYSGTGVIAMYLARKAESVIGVESSEDAVKDALRNCAENGVTGCRFIHGEATVILKQLNRQGERYEVVVVDPPRPGMHPEALRTLIELSPSRIVYVSCNPTSLAADLSRLQAAGYRADRARLVDLFPQTAHCETVIRAVKRA